MYAVEFQSTIRSDNSIAVPKEYKNKLGKRVKVILLSNESVENEDDNRNDFSAVRVKTKGFKFDREYANER